MIIDRRNSVCERWKASSNGRHVRQYLDAKTTFNNINNNLRNFF